MPKRDDNVLSLLERSGAYVYKGKLRLPARASLGSYPLTYYTREFESLCSDCATTDYFEWLYSLNTCEGWQHDPPVYVDVHWEGPAENCAGCNKVMEAAYGDPWAETTLGAAIRVLTADDEGPAEFKLIISTATAACLMHVSSGQQLDITMPTY